MKPKQAKIFVCHHPSGLLLFNNFSRIIKNLSQDVEVILFKVNHPYFSDFDFESYKNRFDKVIEFDFVHYSENFIKSYQQILNFIKKLKETEKNILANYTGMELFMEDSAWLPVNLMLYSLSKNKKISSIFRFVGIDTIKENIKTDSMRTFLYNLYTIFLPCYPIKFTVSADRKFADFQYKEVVPGKKIKVASPVDFMQTQDKNTVPFPIISEENFSGKKDMVLIIGDANIFEEFPEYFSSYRDFLRKTEFFLKALEEKYKDCKIFYKPHPADKNKLMPCIDTKKHIIFDNKKTAQMIFNDYCNRIKAVYTIFSTSAISSSYFGIPSYVCYKYFFNELGKGRLDSVFCAKNIGSRFLLSISELDEIGKIDNLKRPEFFSIDEAANNYKKFLKYGKRK